MKIQKSMRRAGVYLWQQWIRPFATAAAVVLPLKSALADVNWVPTGSMKPTILEGDLIFVNKLAYDLKVPFTLFRVAEWSSPKRGDVVVCFSPEDGVRLVKRVIGIPGDTIEMHDNTLILNGTALDYTIHPDHSFSGEIHEDSSPLVATESSPDSQHWVMSLPHRHALRSFGPTSIPDGKYFIMGDSRDNSRDSRFFGFVERKQIVGKAPGVALSFDKNHYLQPRVKRWFSKFDDAQEMKNE